MSTRPSAERFTARYMHKSDTQRQPYGTVFAGVGSNNLDTVDTTFVFPGWNWLVSATGVLGPSTTLELSIGSAHNSSDFSIGNPRLTRTAAGLADMPLLYPDAVQQEYIPEMRFFDPRFGGGRLGPSAGFYATGNGPFTNENTTWDWVANLTKLWGSHSAKFGAYLQTSFKPQSAFASFNSQINFVDTPANPYDTGFGYANAATGVYFSYAQASSYALSGATRTSSGTPRTTGSPRGA